MFISPTKSLAMGELIWSLYRGSCRTSRTTGSSITSCGAAGIHLHSPHLVHRSVVAELRGALERMLGNLKAVLPHEP